jgi:hypothetical protein
VLQRVGHDPVSVSPLTSLLFHCRQAAGGRATVRASAVPRGGERALAARCVHCIDTGQAGRPNLGRLLGRGLPGTMASG